MRIRLAEEQKRRRRPKSKRRSRTFESAVAVPPLPTHGERTRSRRAMATRMRLRAEQADARPRRRVPWRAIGRRLPALLLVAAVTAILVYAFTDTRFFVYEGHIIGAQHLDAAVIYQAAGIHEQSIFWVDPGAVATRVAQVDGVRDVTVRCELPAVVTIEIEERQPRILWRAMHQERDWWLDEEGTVLPYHGDPESPDTVFVVDYEERELAVGQRVTPDELVDSVLQLAEAMPDVRVFIHQPERGLSFSQEAQGMEWPVYIGGGDDLPRKIQIMRAMTTYLTSNNIQPRYVDVRWADHPVYGRSQAGAQDATGGGE